MSLVKTGRGHLKLAKEALAADSALETQRNVWDEQVKAAEKQAALGMYGLGASTGAAYGLQKLGSAAAASAAPQGAMGALSSVPDVPGLLRNFNVTGQVGVGGGIQLTGGQAAAGTATGGVAGGGGGAAAGSALSTLATPIAIGLGVAFLLNKLFG